MSAAKNDRVDQSAEMRPPASWRYHDNSPEAQNITNGKLQWITFIAVQQGTAQFCRDGRTATARAGSALLVAPGPGELKFFSEGNVPAKAMVIEFDLLSAVGLLRKRQALEEMALVVPAGPKEGTVFSEFIPRLEILRRGRLGPKELVELLLFDTGVRAIGFFRAVYFLPRWRLLVALEQAVRYRHAERDAGRYYPGGVRALRNDCRLFLGEDVDSWLRRRRMQIAGIWLRMKMPAEAVARALGFRDAYEFRREFEPFTGRRCENVSKEEIPLLFLKMGEFTELVRPCWWPAPLPLNPAFREAEPRAAAKGGRLRNDSRQIPCTVMRRLDRKFFSMRSTGADAMVPIFDAVGAPR